MHDISYQYGFTEVAGNFQNDNFGKGGKGGDAVNINVMETSGSENALFLTPPDGQPGRMAMFRYTSTEPNRNPGFDSQIVVHEYGHGISTRLTGGPAATGCLLEGEARGMSEGWSDLFAMIVTAKESHKADTPIILGAYISDSSSGVRTHPFTTDMKANPFTYSDIGNNQESYIVGEVWASMLWEVYWNLVTKNGFSTNLHDAKGKFGNIITMQNMIGGFMLQPCKPTFLSARDAFIASDVAHYNGANKCEIWKGFAKRGLGVKAANSTNDFSVPDECGGGTSSSSSVSIATTTESTTVESATTVQATTTV
ncbi:hypothetical protein RTP6_007353 [Batrachochytrium dendrobatidis]